MKPRQIASVVVIIGLAGLVYGASIPLKRSGKTWNCQTNLKQLGLAMSQYNRDYDEKYPRAVDWMDVLQPYVKGYGPKREANDGRQMRYICPTTNGYYAFNANFDRISMSQDNSPRSSPLFYDMEDGRLNQSDDGKNWPIPPIHTTLQTSGNNVVFGDFHVELRTNKPRFRAFPPLPNFIQTSSASVEKWD